MSLEDKELTYFDRNAPTHEIVPVENGFLAVSDDALLSLDLSSNSVTQISTRFNPPDYEKKVYLVQLKDKSIIMVHRVLINENGKSVTKSFKLYQLTAEKNWTRKRSLGDETLFVGGNSSISVTASDIEGCKPDSIYFVRDGEGSFGTRAWRYDHGVYDVYMGTISQFPISDSNLMKKTRQPPIWVSPTFQL
ncbi:hypothetical protein ACLB2K_061898 [Fragaria x ananassa]